MYDFSSLSTHGKQYKKFLKLNHVKYYLPGECYLEREENSFGKGLVFYKNLQDALNAATKNEGLNSVYRVLNVDIPSNEYMLVIDKSFEEQTEYVRKCLTDSDALDCLFHTENLNFSKRFDKYAEENGISEEERAEKYKEQAKDFFAKKVMELAGLSSGKDIVNYISACTDTNSREMAGSFLSWFGIYGCIFTDENNCERCMIFDPKYFVNPTHLGDYKDRTEESEVTYPERLIK